MSTDTDIQPLLDRIKQDGIAKAREEARQIIERARSEADSIVKSAAREAREAREEHNRAMTADREAFEKSMVLAARDLLLAVQERLRALCETLLRRELQKSLDTQALKEMVLRLVEAWGQNPEIAQLEILLNDQDVKQLEEFLIDELGQSLREGMTLRPIDGVEAGFRVRSKGDDFYFDLSDRGLADMLGAYVNPRVAEFLKKAAQHPADSS